jgi:hypothetical protein
VAWVCCGPQDGSRVLNRRKAKTVREVILALLRAYLKERRTGSKRRKHVRVQRSAFRVSGFGFGLRGL